MSSREGFTLIELLVCVAVLAISIALALPNYGSKVQRQKADSAASLLQLMLNDARAIAVTRGVPSAVCASADRATCIGSSTWHTAALVFADHNADGLRQLSEAIDQTIELGQARVFSSVGRTSARFRIDGSAYGSNLTLAVCEQEGQATRLIVANSGRIRVERKRPEPRCA